MSQLVPRLFWGKLKSLQTRRAKKIYGGGYQFMTNVCHYGFLTRKNYQLKSSTMARNTFNTRHL